jgi:GTP pyrophosphokinase
VRQWFKKQERAENIARGKEMVEKELVRMGTSLSEMQDDLLRLFKFEDLEDFCLRVGYGEISTQSISNKVASMLEEEEPLPEVEAPKQATYTTNIRPAICSRASPSAAAPSPATRSSVMSRAVKASPSTAATART